MATRNGLATVSFTISFNCPPDTLQRSSTCHRTLSHTLSFTQMLSILYKFDFGTAANIFPPLNKTKPQSGFTLKSSAMDSCVACGLSVSSKKKNANHHCKFREVNTCSKHQHMHSYIKKMMQKSMYLLSLSVSDEAMKRHHNGILRIVALSVRKKR